MSHKNGKIDFEAPLSPEADKYLAEATSEFNSKQDMLRRDWYLGAQQQWWYDQVSGILRLDFADGSQLQADGQILGSYSTKGRSWEWAWNNPYVQAEAAKDSQAAKEVGERLGISYLQVAMVSLPGEEFVSYLCAIGVKAADSIGIFRGKAGPIDVLITLKNPRWSKKAR